MEKGIKKVVVFELARELYGMDIFNVREIIKEVPVTKVPMAPDFIEGIINLRGKIIPIVDLRKRFGLEAKRDGTGETRIVIVEISGQEAGLVVDSVKEVATIDESIIEPAPAVSTINASFIEGVAKRNNELIILLTLDLLLEAGEKESLSEMEQKAAV